MNAADRRRVTGTGVQPAGRRPGTADRVRRRRLHLRLACRRGILRPGAWPSGTAMALLALALVFNLLAPIVFASPPHSCCADPLCQCANCVGDEHGRSCCSSDSAAPPSPQVRRACHRGDPQATPVSGGLEVELPTATALEAASTSGPAGLETARLPIPRPSRVSEPVPRSVA